VFHVLRRQDGEDASTLRLPGCGSYGSAPIVHHGRLLMPARGKVLWFGSEDAGGA
jgi:hypothetical protein